MTAINGPYLLITWKPKTIFSEWLKNEKITYFKKKKIRISWIFQYFDILIGGFHNLIYKDVK